LTRPEVVVGIKEEGESGLAIPPRAAALLIEASRVFGTWGREGGREREGCEWWVVVVGRKEEGESWFPVAARTPAFLTQLFECIRDLGEGGREGWMDVRL